MRLCYQCKLRKSDEFMAWISSKDDDAGLCLRCHAIGKLKEEMENVSLYTGRPMEGFDHIKIDEGTKIVCPHCGYIEEDCPESSALYEEQDDYEYLCQECEQEFLLQVHVVVTYISKKEVSFKDVEKRYIKTTTDESKAD